MWTTCRCRSRSSPPPAPRRKPAPGQNGRAGTVSQLQLSSSCEWPGACLDVDHVRHQRRACAACDDAVTLVEPARHRGGSTVNAKSDDVERRSTVNPSQRSRTRRCRRPQATTRWSHTACVASLRCAFEAQRRRAGRCGGGRRTGRPRSLCSTTASPAHPSSRAACRRTSAAPAPHPPARICAPPAPAADCRRAGGDEAHRVARRALTASAALARRAVATLALTLYSPHTPVVSSAMLRARASGGALGPGACAGPRGHAGGLRTKSCSASRRKRAPPTTPPASRAG